MLLKRWAGADQRAWYFNKNFPIPVPRRTSISDIFGESHINSYKKLDGSEVTEAETELSKIESQLDQFVVQLERFVEKRDITSARSVNGPQLHLLYRNLSIRSPKFRRKHQLGDEKYERLIAEPIRDYLKRGTRFDFDVSNLLSETTAKRNLAKLIEVRALSSSWRKVPEDFLRIGFLVLTPKRQQKSFVVGPTCNTNNRVANIQDLSVLRVTPKIAIAPFQTSERISILDCEDGDVRRLNSSMFRENVELVALNEAILLSLVQNG